MSRDLPLISCLMVTRNRVQLAARALRCFAQQTWGHKELVIVDDGDEDYTPTLLPLQDRFAIRYHRVRRDPSRRLGALRNMALDLATGEFCAQWDDDDWYHPDRLATQMRALTEQELDACVLRWTLMHLDTSEFVEHLYRTELRRGTAGTILHRRTSLRYQNLPRHEDSVFRRQLARRARLGIVRQTHSHLFVRCYHGANTWDAKHFTERLHRRIIDKIRYVHARWIRRDLLTHPLFRLTPSERSSARQFLEESRALGLLSR